MLTWLFAITQIITRLSHDNPIKTSTNQTEWFDDVTAAYYYEIVTNLLYDFPNLSEIWVKTVFMKTNVYESVVCKMVAICIGLNLWMWHQCKMHRYIAWWRHQMETFSALLAIFAGYSPVPGEFPAQRPVTRSFGVFFDLRLNKRLSKQSWGWWFDTLSRSLRRHRNGISGGDC